MRSEQNNHTRKRKRKRKLRVFRVIIVVFFLLFVSTLAYAYFQYKQGVEDAEKNTGTTKQKTYEFNGEKDKYGGISILLIGSDSREGENARSDTIMLAQYNPKKETYKLMSIMRDTYVDIPGHGKNKINAAYAYGGPELLRKTLKENFDIDVTHYAIVDFQGFIHVIDEAFPNGVEMNVEKAMSADVELKPGLQRLDGEHLLGYVRFRHDALGDFNRVERQQKALKEVASQLASIQTLTKLPKLVGVITPYVNTNMSTSDIIYIGKDYLSEENRDISTMRIPVDNSYEPQRINGIGEVLRVDLDANTEAIDEFLKK